MIYALNRCEHHRPHQTGHARFRVIDFRVSGISLTHFPPMIQVEGYSSETVNDIQASASDDPVFGQDSAQEPGQDAAGPGLKRRLRRAGLGLSGCGIAQDHLSGQL